jgi:hypothetical protein
MSTMQEQYYPEMDHYYQDNGDSFYQDNGDSFYQDNDDNFYQDNDDDNFSITSDNSFHSQHSLGSLESVEHRNHYDDDLLTLIPNNITSDMMIRPTLAQDLKHIDKVLKNKSYLNKIIVVESSDEEIISECIAPWKDFRNDTTVDFNDIVKTQEEEVKLPPPPPPSPKNSKKYKKEYKKEYVAEEDDYDLSRLVRNSTKTPPKETKSPIQKESMKKDPDGPDKTRLCKFGKRCVSQKKCDRVHTLQDWEPNMCHYDHKCRILRKCRFIHSRDTKQDYLKRIIQQEDNRFYFGNQHLYLKNFGIQIKTEENDTT